MSQRHFNLDVRVYIEDTDVGGIVYYVNYLKYMERARTEWLRSLGREHYSLAGDDYQLVVHSCQIDYKKPALMDDALSVSAELVKKGKAYLLFEQQVKRAGELLVRAEIKIACVSSTTLKPRVLPEALSSL